MSERKGRAITTFELPSDLLARLRALADHEDVSVGHLVRKGIGLYVESRIQARNVTPEVKAILGKA